MGIVKDQATGLLFDVKNVEECAEKIFLLAMNEALLKKMSINSRQRALDDLSISLHCRKIQSVYEELLTKV